MDKEPILDLARARRQRIHAQHQHGHDKIAKTVGKSRGHITNTLRLVHRCA